MPTLRTVTLQLLIAISLSCSLLSISFSALPTHVPTAIDSASRCDRLAEWKWATPYDESSAIEQYDSLKTYIESCYLDSTSYEAFPSMDGTIPMMSPYDTLKYARYRDWLISVIFLTPQPEYFCNCLYSIASTYKFYKGYSSVACVMTVLDYLRKQSHCYGKGLDRQYTDDSLYMLKMGGDPTNLPPLDSLELGFLNNVNSSPATPAALVQALGVVSASPNPFRSVTTIRFELSRASFVSVALYDALGNEVWTSGRGNTLSPGVHEVNIPSDGLPSETLYARISTGFGEVKTVKLVHQE